MRNILLYILMVFCLVYSLDVSIYAQDVPFTAQFVTNYYLDTQANTRVEQNIVLKNTSSSTYATEYALEISATNLDNIKVNRINGNNLPFNATETPVSTIITISFNEPVVGKDAELKFQVSYTQTGIANLAGEVLEINIPKLAPNQQTGSILTHLHIPQSFGEPTYISPKFQFHENREGTNIYSFVHGSQQTGMIRAVFGAEQTMQFTLNYHLENSTINRGVTQITIPPDTPYQKVYYTKIEPTPDSIHPDIDGNWLATYTLEPKQQIDVVVQGMVELYLDPKVIVPNYSGDLAKYLEPQTYWETNHPEIQALASSLNTPEAIYNYLIENFTYNYDKLDASVRLGAAQALLQPDNVVCLEFTDAFIALARAAGIPARAHNGFAYTTNPNLRPLSLVKDILHAWPEYYDQETKQWIQVDPTWGKTTGGVDYFQQMDLNHFTFVIHGVNSSRPFPAGYYKFAQSSEKDILVEFTTQPIPEIGQISMSLEPSLMHLLGIPWPATLIINNQTNRALYNSQLELTTDKWSAPNSSIIVPTMLPFSQVVQTIKLKPPRPFFLSPDQIAINSDIYNGSINIQISSQQQLLFGVSVISVGIFFGGIAYGSWRLLVSRRK